MAKGFWQRWKRFAHRAAEIQSFVILTLLYWVIVVPIALVQRSGKARPSVIPEWKTRQQSAPVTLETARRQS